jgi:hypothetical protein
MFYTDFEYFSEKKGKRDGKVNKVLKHNLENNSRIDRFTFKQRLG